MRWKILFFTIFAVVIAGFTLLNSTEVAVNFLFASTQMNLIFVILLSVLLGMLSTTLLWSAQTFKLRKTAKELRRKMGDLETQVAACREKLQLHTEPTHTSLTEVETMGVEPEKPSSPIE